MRKERKPKPLKLPSNVRLSDDVEKVDWCSKEYFFEDNESWKDSLHICYYRPPIVEFEKYNFFYTPDSQKQLATKSDVAHYALNSIMAKYDTNYEGDVNFKNHRSAFSNQMHNFFGSL